MATKRALLRISFFMLILMVVLMPFAQPSRTRFLGGSRAAEETETITKELETKMVARFGNGGSVFTVEGREVPTGPDPLHHHGNPTGP